MLLLHGGSWKIREQLSQTQRLQCGIKWWITRSSLLCFAWLRGLRIRQEGRWPLTMTHIICLQCNGVTSKTSSIDSSQDCPSEEGTPRESTNLIPKTPSLSQQPSPNDGKTFCAGFEMIFSQRVEIENQTSHGNFWVLRMRVLEGKLRIKNENERSEGKKRVEIWYETLESSRLRVWLRLRVHCTMTFSIQIFTIKICFKIAWNVL